ncbi:MAG: Lrp/AsnC family transcriptional regulator [Proteobacteria bacterium]|nr:Lrp/AsnC family transcriptional regulator [Pseudomonadota bacterium]
MSPSTTNSADTSQKAADTKDIVLSKLERDFINNFQGNFPLVERPFDTIAKELSCTEDELIKAVQHLKEQKTLTRFGPLYDAARLGGGLTLAAISVPENRYEIVTALVNTYPEVAHNYRREHELNMWFVIATEAQAELLKVISSIEKTTSLRVYNFPKQQEFYIGLWLHLDENNKVTTMPVPENTAIDDVEAGAYQLDDSDRKILRITQSGLPVESKPYLGIAHNIGLTEDDVIQRLKRMLACGIIRRIGAVPNHYKLGLTANGMTVWDVSDDRVTELGNLIGQLDFVSHCYQRPRHLPMWRYNMFAMVHGSGKDEVNAKAKKIEQLLGDNCKAHDTLYSSAILKKTGLRLAA